MSTEADKEFVMEVVDDLKSMLAWAYSKLVWDLPENLMDQDDALMLDRIKLFLEHGEL